MNDSFNKQLQEIVERQNRLMAPIIKQQSILTGAANLEIYGSLANKIAPMLKVSNQHAALISSISELIPNRTLNLEPVINFQSNILAKNFNALINPIQNNEVIEAYKNVLNHISKYDFRIEIIGKTLEKNLSVLFEQTADAVEIENNHEHTDFDKVLFESLVETEQNNDDTDDTREMKKMITAIYENQTQQAFKKDIEEKEQSRNTKESFNSKALLFINSVLFAINLLTSPKDIYELFLWVNEIIQYWINK